MRSDTLCTCECARASRPGAAAGAGTSARRVRMRWTWQFVGTYANTCHDTCHLAARPRGTSGPTTGCSRVLTTGWASPPGPALAASCMGRLSTHEAARQSHLRATAGGRSHLRATAGGRSHLRAHLVLLLLRRLEAERLDGRKHPCLPRLTTGAPWSTLEYPGVPRSTLEYPGAPWSTPEYPGAPMSTLEGPHPCLRAQCAAAASTSAARAISAWARALPHSRFGGAREELCRWGLV